MWTRRYSFILVSIIFLLKRGNSYSLHAAIKDTARPAYSFVLQDDARTLSARLQRPVYALCFTYAMRTSLIGYVFVLVFFLSDS